MGQGVKGNGKGMLSHWVRSVAENKRHVCRVPMINSRGSVSCDVLMRL